MENSKQVSAFLRSRISEVTEHCVQCSCFPKRCPFSCRLNSPQATVRCRSSCTIHTSLDCAAGPEESSTSEVQCLQNSIATDHESYIWRVQPLIKLYDRTDCSYSERGWRTVAHIHLVTTVTGSYSTHRMNQLSHHIFFSFFLLISAVSFMQCPESNIKFVTAALNTSLLIYTIYLIKWRTPESARPDVLVIVEKKATENVDS